jgi:drug/metabolite transporter (DMT)-like permease
MSAIEGSASSTLHLPQAPRALATGTLFALAAGLAWGLVFIAPVLLPEYPAALLACGRYLAFGLVALPLAWLDRRRLAELTRDDWLEALKLAAIGNLLYYLCLAAAIQRAGSPLPTMLIGALPLVIAVCANLRDHARDGWLPWPKLAAPLLLIAAGIACVNHAEWQRLVAADGGAANFERYATGALLALGAVACWTWYPLRNADWLRGHPNRSPATWSTAQGIATLPLAALGYAAFWAFTAWQGGPAAASMPLGPRPWEFLGLMLAIAVFASWLGTLCWNAASQRLPTSLVGQLIVFETLAALAYGLALRGQWPSPWVAAGIALLVAGVLLGVRVRPVRRNIPAASTA